MANFINKYNTTSAYSDDASARAALGSTVSLDVQANEIHYDGVNVEVKRPKAGDAVYADETNNKVIFYAGETLQTDSSNGYRPKGSRVTDTTLKPVGVVATVHGNKVEVLYHTQLGMRFIGATSGSIHNDDYAVLSQYGNNLNIADSEGRSGTRCLCNYDIVYNWLNRKNWTPNEGETNGFWKLAQWNDGSTVSDATHTRYGDTNTNPTPEAYELYLRSRVMGYPCTKLLQGAVLGKEAEITKKMYDLTVANSGGALNVQRSFPAAYYAYTHLTSYSSNPSDPFDVDGLRLGDWHMMGLQSVIEVLSKLQYVSKDAETSSNDVFNRTLSKITNFSSDTNKLNLNVDSDSNRYWLPCVRSASFAWDLYTNGHFNSGSNVSYSRRVLSVALLTIGED